MIIGIGHRREVGKDLFGQMLQSELAYRKPDLHVVRTAFADPIYKICNELYGWAGFKSKDYYDHHKEEKENKIIEPIGKTARQILIDMGTPAVRKQVWDGTWLHYALNIKADLIIITDLRFPNEFQAIKDKNGLCVRIERDVPRVIDPFDPDNQLINQEGWDALILNTGTKRELSEHVERFVEFLTSDHGV